MIFHKPKKIFFFFFQVLLTTTSFSSVLSCEDLLISSFHRSANMWIFIYLILYPILLVIPGSFLTLILCPFWHEHTCRRIQHSSIRLRYRTKLLLWSVIRFGLSNLQVYPKINFFLRPSRVSTIKLTCAFPGSVHI